MPVDPRTQARELVLKGLYAFDSGAQGKEVILREIIADEGLPEASLESARDQFQLVLDHREWSNQIISELADNWELERIALIDQIIMRMALVEFKTRVDVPVKVVLNEAIELAKKYSTAESSKFINGILDSYIKRSPERSEP